MFRKNVSQVVPFAMVTTAGAADAAATVNAKRVLDGTLSSVAGNILNVSGGAYALVMASADCDATTVGLFFTASGDVPQMVGFRTTAANPDDTARFGLLNLSSAAPGTQSGFFICGSNAGTTTIGALNMGGGMSVGGGITANITGNLTGNVSGSVGSVTGLSSAIVASAVWNSLVKQLSSSQVFDLTGNLIGNVTGNLAGSVGSVTGAVGSVTGAVGSVTGAVGSVTGNVGGNVNGNVLGSVLGNLGGYVSASGANAIAVAHLDLADAIEAGLTVRQAHRLECSAAAAKLSGAGTTTVTIRDAVADSKDRIVATVDASGNRSAITYDLT